MQYKKSATSHRQHVSVRLQAIEASGDSVPTGQNRCLAPLGLIGALAVLVLSLGCQTNRLSHQALPIPPTRLDTSALSQVRFQSGGSDTRTGSGNRNTIRSFNRELSLGTGPEIAASEPPSGDRSQIVRDVIIRGNQRVPTHHLTRTLRTRPGRYFDPDKLQEDINQLWRKPEIARINGPYLKHSPEGITITIEVVERQTISDVTFEGNRGISAKRLLKESGLAVGDPYDLNRIRMAQMRLEDFYRKKGYPEARVEIVDGNTASPSTVAFRIHEDQKQKIWKVEFEGNTIASAGRLRTFIKAKPGVLKLIGGVVIREEMEQDVLRLTNYYRSLGFFNAEIHQEVDTSKDGRWLTIRYRINEGPRYRVRNVSFVGNHAFTSEQLLSQLKLKPQVGISIKNGGPPEFNVSKMNQDVVALRDLYGSQGFVFSKVEAEPRFLEEPGLLDIVYKIHEGQQYRAGNINIHFDGEYGITRRDVILQRLSIKTGDLIDARKLRASERRLGASQIFATGGTPGASPPKIVVHPRELQELERQAYSGSASRHY